MARRMFSDQIIDSDVFLNMPISTQNYYFHLNMKADDDGFVKNPMAVMRNTKASQDDYLLLIAKRFIIAFDNGIIVIKHWRIHNLMRWDRYKPTVYQDQMALLDIKENKAYTLKEIPDPTDLFDFIHEENTFGNQPATKEKKREEKLIEEKKEIIEHVSSQEEILVESHESKFGRFWDAYPKKKAKDKAEAWFKRKKPTSELVDTMIQVVEKFKKTHDWIKEEGKFIPYPSTWLNAGGWKDELDQKEVKDGKDSKPTETFKYIPRRDRQPRNDEADSSK